MIRAAFFGCLTVFSVAAMFPLAADAGEVSGVYLETRTCQVYTGPCFANGEVGLAGKEAIMAWRINKGKHQGVDLSGMSVVVVVSGDATFGFGGLGDPSRVKSVILLDDRAKGRQKAALLAFAKERSGRAGKYVVRVASKPIEMSLDTDKLAGKLIAGKEVKLVTRKARPDDCICSNESAYYPPLAKVTDFAPGVAIEGSFRGRGLGSRWSVPDSRSVYMATFEK